MGMAIEFSDLLGVLAVVLYLAGIGAITTRALMLRRQQGGGRGWVSVLLVLVTLAYIAVVLGDAPSVLTILNNQISDIPPTSALRTGTFGLWTWLVHAVLLHLAYGRKPR